MLPLVFLRTIVSPVSMTQVSLSVGARMFCLPLQTRLSSFQHPIDARPVDAERFGHGLLFERPPTSVRDADALNHGH
jgi:hypothetical protein